MRRFVPIATAHLLLCLCAACPGEKPEKAAPPAPQAAAPAPAAPEPAPAPEPEPPPSEPEPVEPTWPLRVPLQAVGSAKIAGSVTLAPAPEGAVVTLTITAGKRGTYGVHIHETPDCSAPATGSMGGHFAPEGQIHGLPDSANHHRGDLGNVQIDDAGHGELQLEIKRVSLEPGAASSLLNRTVVVRSRKDDGLTEDAGVPIACTVLGE